jgi:F-type H+-transporting ATPase subunit gamma
MATLRDIRRRIRSVKKTQQITSAMRMVAAAKLRRAQDAILAARPYARRMYATLAEVGRREKGAEHPLLQPRSSRGRFELLVVTADRGLCGAFNANAIKKAEATLGEQATEYREVCVAAAGRKALEHFRRRRSVAASWTDFGTVQYAHAAAIAEHLAQRYVSGEIDGAAIVFNDFVSAITQRPTVLPLLPFAREPASELAQAGSAPPPYEMEPDPKSLLDVLVPNALEFTVLAALLETQAGFYAAQMTAMESATRNTAELISSLTLQFNRARQAAITKELVEIVSGAEALN